MPLYFEGNYQSIPDVVLVSMFLCLVIVAVMYLLDWIEFIIRMNQLKVELEIAL